MGSSLQEVRKRAGYCTQGPGTSVGRRFGGRCMCWYSWTGRHELGTEYHALEPRFGRIAHLEDGDTMSPSNIEFLAYVPTPLGDLCLRRRELLSRPGTVITEVTLDHELLMSSFVTVSERALADEALARNAGDDLRVLVGGLGLGYTASQALASPRVGHEA
jgi:hypothetical protein